MRRKVREGRSWVRSVYCIISLITMPPASFCRGQKSSKSRT